MSLLLCFFGNDSGSTAIEYVMLAALIGVALIVLLDGVGNGLNSTFNSIVAGLS
ncbi:MAG: Flp family type IVb pilin [Pseudomonadota bacterium]